MHVKYASVLFVDDDPDLRSVMHDTFVRLGARACSEVGSLPEVQKFGAAIHAFDVIVIDINLGAGKANGVEVFYWLDDQDFKGRVIFLTGHAHDDPRVLTAAAITGALILSKPVRSSELQRAMGELST